MIKKHQDNLILAIQGSYQRSSLALVKNGNILSQVDLDSFQASSQLIPCIGKLLEKNNLNLKDLTHIAVDRGPGAFSSLRVTITTANALAYALDIKIIGFNGLQIAAQSFVEKKNRAAGLLGVVFNAYSNQVYFSLFDAKKKMFLIQDVCISLSEVCHLLEKHNVLKDEVFFIGNLPENLKKEFQVEPYFVSAEEIALAAEKKIYENGEFSQFVYPLYIKQGFYS